MKDSIKKHLQILIYLEHQRIPSEFKKFVYLPKKTSNNKQYRILSLESYTSTISLGLDKNGGRGK